MAAIGGCSHPYVEARYLDRPEMFCHEMVGPDVLGRDLVKEGRANWLVSKEGQISQFAAEGTAPARRDLQMAKLLNYSEQIQCRQQAGGDVTKLEILEDIWGDYWKKAPKKGKGRKRKKSHNEKGVLRFQNFVRGRESSARDVLDDFLLPHRLIR